MIFFFCDNLGAGVVALAIERGRVVKLEKKPNQGLVRALRRHFHLQDLDVARLARAHFLIRRIGFAVREITKPGCYSENGE